MPKLIIFIPLLIILLPIVFSETQIFAGSVITDTDVKIANSTYRFTYEETSGNVFVLTPSKSLIVESGKCKSSDVLKVCVGNASYYDRNITTYVTYYKLFATIYKLTGSISTSSNVVLDTLLQGESTDYSITISNPTDFEITNIKFSEDLSKFIVKEAKGCDYDEHKLSWQGSLTPKFDKTCALKLIADKEGTYDLAGTVSYFNSYETETKATSSVRIKVLPKQLKIVNLFDKNVEVNNPFYFNLSLQNVNQEERISAKGMITLPPNLALLNKVLDFSREINILKLEKYLEPSTSYNYSFYLLASAEGNKPIIESFDYVIKNLPDAIENDTYINPVEPRPVLNITTDYNESAPGERFIVVAKITNPSRFHKFKDIKAELKAPFNEELFQAVDILMPNESYKLFSNTLVVPKNINEGLHEQNATYKINLSLSYNLNDVEKSASKVIELKLKQSTVNASLSSNLPIQIKQNASSVIVNGTLKATSANETPPVNKTQLSFFNAKILIFSGIILIVFLGVFIIINRRRKKKSDVLEQQAIKELNEKLPEK